MELCLTISEFSLGTSLTAYLMPIQQVSRPGDAGDGQTTNWDNITGIRRGTCTRQH